MAQPHREVEIKLEIDPAAVKRLTRYLRAHANLREAPQVNDLRSVYFDTKRQRLRRKGFSLRVREIGGQRVQTIKHSGNGAAGLFERAEWEETIEGRDPDWKVAKRSGLAPLVNKKLRARAKPVFETRVRRTSYRVRGRGGDIKLVLDEGSIKADARSTPVAEIELEVEKGRPATAFEFARALARIAPLILSTKSKAERGYDLLAGEQAQAVKSAPVPLTAEMTVEQAFRAIGHECLRHFAANRAAVCQGDLEGVHQMRVGLRRMRAAISLFSDAVNDSRLARIKAELKWLTKELAPARDLDVFLAEMPRLPRRLAISGDEGFRDELAGRRERAHERAEQAASSDRFRTLLLDVAQWLEGGPWTRAGGAPGKRRAQAIEDFTVDELSRRRKKIKKRARKLKALDPGQRHKLRIASKKLRYGVEFCAALFDGKRSRKRRKAFLGALKDLQSALGGLNDVAAREQLAAAVAAKRHANGAKPQRAFAAGWITAQEEARAKPLLKAAAKAGRALRDARPPWA
jgi:inorganic triphosphatase YgiF